MYSLIRQEITRQVDGLENRKPSEFKALGQAWKASREWQETKTRPVGDPVLLPLVGSGLNNLCAGPLGSWADLLKAVRDAVGKARTENEIRRSGLTSTQELELILRRADEDKDARARLVGVFEKAFGPGLAASAFHERIMRLFPAVITTNYNDFLQKAAPGCDVFDVTDPEDVASAAALTPGIFHLHGRWNSPVAAEREAKIFRGVGLQEMGDGPCLVITEYQYHKLYSMRDSYRDAVRQLLASNNPILFLGSSLAPEETGVHVVLTERVLARREGPAGLYVGLNMPQERVQQLELRGLLAISLPWIYGFRRKATEALFHAFFDTCEERFASNPGGAAATFPVPGPEVLCAGIASWNTVISLEEKAVELGKETSHKVSPKHQTEEPGGQHLYAALHLIRRGHVVALATVVGDDWLGDRILSSVREYIIKAERSGGGDLITAYCGREGSTRHSTTITFSGTRVIFDFDGDMGRILAPALPQAWSYEGIAPKALYLGSYFPESQESILALLSAAPLRFFETGTTGPPEAPRFSRAIDIARRCSHVLSSAAFAIRLATGNASKENPRSCQDRLIDDYEKTGGDLAKAAVKAIWNLPDSTGTLLITMGEHGALIAVRDAGGSVQLDYAPCATVNATKVNWLGCGDLFRAEFIHQILSGRTPTEAAAAGAAEVAARIGRITFLPASDDPA